MYGRSNLICCPTSPNDPNFRKLLKNYTFNVQIHFELNYFLYLFYNFLCMNLFFRRKTANLLKSTLRCGYFSRFLNCINSTKKRKASQIMNIKKSSSRCGGITRENTKNNNKGKTLAYQLCLHNTSTKLILLFTHSY